MKTTTNLALLLAGSCLVFGVPSASAQIIPGRTPNTGVNPIGRPVVSPFLNLFRGGNPAINYYGLVRPQQEFASSLQQLQQQASLPATSLDQAGPLVTGHSVQFMNFAPFYNRRIGGTAALSPSAVAPATLAPVALPSALSGAGRR